jgi:hypothetical protein
MRSAPPFILLIIANLLPFSSLSASPWFIFGFDGPSIGLGNALSGGVAGPASVYYNPAGLGESTTLTTTISYLYARPFLKYKQDPNPSLLDLSNFQPLEESQVCRESNNTDDCRIAILRYNRYIQGARKLYTYELDLKERIEDRTANTLPLHGLSVGVAYPLPDTVVPVPVVVGGGVFALLDPFAVLYQRIKGTTSPYFLRFDDSPHRLAIDGGVGVRPLRWLEIGGGVDFLLGVDVTPDLRVIFPPELHIFDPFPFPNPNLKDIRFYVDGEVLEPVVLAPVAGIKLLPLEWLSIGASFREEQKAKIKLSGTAQIVTPQGVSQLPVDLLTSAAFTPRVIAGGFHLGPFRTSRWRLDLYGEVAYQRWSTYIPPFGITAQIGGVSGVSCDLVKSLSDLEEIARIAKDLPGGNLLTNLLNPDSLCTLLQGNVQDQLKIQTFDPKLVHFRDTWNPAVGVGVGVSRFQLNLGYRYEPSAIGTQTDLYNILDPDRDIFSLYAGYRVMERVEIGAYGQLHRVRPAHVEKKTYNGKPLSSLDEETTPDAYPDPNLPRSSYDPALEGLKERTAGVQLLSPGYPGFSVGGSYLTMGLHVSVEF